LTAARLPPKISASPGKKERSMVMPLDGIRVVDLTRLAPGPFCTMILADFGAEVIKVEQPGGGRRAEMERAAQGGPDQKEERRRAALNAHSRNKRSIALDLKFPEAKEVFYKLARAADVVLEGFRPGVVKRLGVDYETVAKLNPRVVYCSISGYGQDGPYAELVGHDINYASFAGALSVMGEAGRKPAMPVNLLGDYAGGGMHAALAICLALLARQKTGRGQYIDISMTDGIVYLLASLVSERYQTGVLPQRGQHRLNGGVPYYDTYECADGRYISVGCNEPWFYENLCKLLGLEQYDKDQWNTAKHPEVRRAFTAAFKTKSRDEWFEIMKPPQEVCIAKVLDLDELFDDPQLRHRGMAYERPDTDLGTIRQVGIGPQLSETPGSIRTLGPTTGQHTDEVLRGLDYSKADIAALKSKGAVA
jgi:crotonobetainyl-CoA:carnitine CoA-transferase CaiB-like acyl-CoA transferase